MRGRRTASGSGRVPLKRVAAATVAGGLLVAVGLLALSRAARGPAAGELSADEIVAKNVAARGGLAAWREVGTMVWIGRIESAHAPAPAMPFTLEQKRPNRTRLQIDALGSRSLRVFDGPRGWKVAPGRGEEAAQPYTPQELRSAQAGHGIDGPLIDHAAKGNSVTLESVDQVGQRKAYRLKVHLAKGGDEDVWVDTETYLELRHDRMVDAPAGAPRRLSVTYGDYRAVEGLQIPFLIETGGGADATPDRMRIERVVLNVPLDDAMFGNPADPRARHRARMSFAPRLATTASASAGVGAGEDRGPEPR